MNKKTIAIIAIVIIAIVAVCGAYFMMGSSSSNTVKIGYLPSDHDSALFIAQAQKDYDAKGIHVETVQFNNGGDLMTAMASGDIDIGYAGITPVLSSIEKGVPVKVVSGAQIEGSGIVVAKNSSISSVADLKGKQIATPGEASIQYMLLESALKSANLNISDASVSAMKVASMSDALNSGKLDAICTYEPYVTLATESGYGRVLEDSSQILPDHPCCVVVARQDFIDNHADKLKDILAIHNNTTKYIQEHPDEAADKLPSNIVANSTVEKKVLSNMSFISGLNDTYKQSVIDFMNTEVDMGLLKQAISEDKIFYNV